MRKLVWNPKPTNFPFMSSPRLRVQFETLFEHYQGKDCGVQLEEITEILFCTRRNARIVLNKMEEEGWLEWHPAPGRGKLSQLVFKRSRSDVSETLARRYLDEGKISQALKALDQDTAKLAQVIESYLGVVHQQGEQVIRLPYYRPLSTLNPAKRVRRSELHIITQIFSGLTKIGDQERIEPDIAHNWELVTPQHWRFYIRSGVRFHNGELLTIEHILSVLRRLSQNTLFSHIECVECRYANTIDVYLSRPDYHLPVLLAESSAKITLPERDQQDDYDAFPIGTGPFKVVQNDAKRLVLQAHDGYFGYRPLLDRVEVWVIERALSSMIFPSLSQPIATGIERVTDNVELDPGCTFLLFNRKTGLAKESQWASYFHDRLATLNLFKQIPDEKLVELGALPAHGLKPGWYHHIKTDAVEAPSTEREVTVAYQSQHPMFPTLVKCIERVLKQDKVSVRLIRYEHETPDLADVDIWVKAMGITNNRDDALAAWLLSYSDIEAMSQSDDFQYWQQLVMDWQSDQNRPFPAKALGQSLVERMQLIPMFHCWLGVSKDQCGSLQNAQCNALGWFDFSSVWVKPELGQ